MVISQTPLRISLLGGGTDFPDFYKDHGGAVFGLAIDKYIYVIVKERFDDMIYINYSQKEITETVDGVQHDLVREAMRQTGVIRGVEITTLADIPSEGSGLGSSSSVTVGLLNSLYAYANQQIATDQLRDEAIRIELEALEKPIGVQDQTMAAHGGLMYVEFRETDEIAVHKDFASDSVTEKLVDNLMLFYTKRTRSADVILAQQARRVPGNSDQLKELAKLAAAARDALANGDVDRIGNLMHEGWVYKKSLSEGITDPHIDEMYQKAMEAGALGGKIAGAGGGGFLLIYCKEGKRSKVREALSEYKELKFGKSNSGSKMAFNINM